jgi:hypothetical protein
VSAGTRDELLSRILDAMEKLVGRVARLERALTDSADMALELAELRADHEVAMNEQSSVNDALAARLGGVLVRIDPPRPPPDLRLVVDNDNSPPPEGGA